MKRLNVTVSVDLNDIVDVLAWREFGLDAVQGPDARRWLERYAYAAGDQRDVVWQHMPASLQWCVHESEMGRDGHLRDLRENHLTPSELSTIRERMTSSMTSSDSMPGSCRDGNPTSGPRRVQQRRTKGWRKPENTVSVARPSKFGNPFAIGHTYSVVDSEGVIIDFSQRRSVYVRDAAHAVALYAEWVNDRIRLVSFHWRPSPADIRQHLAGKNLMCFCREGQPCHVDVLLEIANGA